MEKDLPKEYLRESELTKLMAGMLEYGNRLQWTDSNHLNI